MTATRKGATRAADIPAHVLHTLSRGEMQSATLAECLALDQAMLARTVFAGLSAPALCCWTRWAKQVLRNVARTGRTWCAAGPAS